MARTTTPPASKEAPGPPAGASALETRFRLRERGTSPRIEFIAGLTTFFTMAYIIFVNTDIMKVTGMDPVALTIGTIIAAAVPTLVLGLWADLPWALAPGMGYNALFAYTIVLGHQMPWQAALALVFLDGIAFTLIVSGPWARAIIEGIPLNLKLAAGAGIGLFIAFIGMVNSGVVQLSVSAELKPGVLPFGGSSALPVLGPLSSPSVVIALLGLIITGWLMARNVRAAILLGIVATTLLAWIAGAVSADWRAALAVHYPAGLGDIVQLPDLARWLNLGVFKMDFAGLSHFTTGALILFFLTFLVTDMMDSFGTFSGLAAKLGILDRNSNFPGSRQTMFVDAAAGAFGPLVGTATVATFIESSAGVGEGGRTGLASVWTAIFFLLALFFVPLVGLVPPVATAPALLVVGFLMIEPVLQINFADITEGLPAFLTLAVMPLTYSIADGMFAGIVSYVLLKLLTGRVRQVSLTMWAFAILLLLAKILDAVVT
jgi:AGZA family xanthine/uracil permease-like MFS transporter